MHSTPQQKNLLGNSQLSRGSARN